MAILYAKKSFSTCFRITNPYYKNFSNIVGIVLFNKNAEIRVESIGNI